MLLLATVSIATTSAARALHPQGPHPPIDSLMLFGFLSSGLAAVCFLRRQECRAAMIVFALSLLATAVYGVLQGAWPLGLLEAGWAAAAIRQSLFFGISGSTLRRTKRATWKLANSYACESRMSRMFGSN